MNEFLKVEYEQCLKLISYYDERHQSLVKYACGLSSSIPALLLTLWNIKNGENQYFWLFSSLISFVTFIGLSSLFVVLTQTRLYFVYPTRQVNAIRKFLLQNQDTDKPIFSDNQMYLDTSFNAFKLLSTQTVLNVFIALQIGLFFSLTLFSYLVYKVIFIHIYWYLLCTLLIASITFSISAMYLYKKSQLHPDISIHNNR